MGVMVPMLPCSFWDEDEAELEEDDEGAELDEDEGAVTEGIDEEDSSLSPTSLFLEEKSVEETF